MHGINNTQDLDTIGSTLGVPAGFGRNGIERTGSTGMTRPELGQVFAGWPRTCSPEGDPQSGARAAPGRRANGAGAALERHLNGARAAQDRNEQKSGTNLLLPRASTRYTNVISAWHACIVTRFACIPRRDQRRLLQREVLILDAMPVFGCVEMSALISVHLQASYCNSSERWWAHVGDKLGLVLDPNSSTLHDRSGTNRTILDDHPPTAPAQARRGPGTSQYMRDVAMCELPKPRRRTCWMRWCKLRHTHTQGTIFNCARLAIVLRTDAVASVTCYAAERSRATIWGEAPVLFGDSLDQGGVRADLRQLLKPLETKLQEQALR